MLNCNSLLCNNEGMKKIIAIAFVAIAIVIGCIGYFIVANNDKGIDPDDFTMGESTAPFAPAYKMPLQSEGDERGLVMTAEGTFGNEWVRVNTPEVSNLNSVTRSVDVLLGSHTNTCTKGFAVTDGAKTYTVTAGHCSVRSKTTPEVTPTVENYGTFVDSLVRTDGENDWAMFEDDTVANYAGMGMMGSEGQMPLNGVVAPHVGMNVCSYGFTTGWRCGTVTGVADESFTTNFVSRTGDSGGVIIAGNKVVGITAKVKHNDNGDVEYSRGTRADHILRESRMHFVAPEVQ